MAAKPRLKTLPKDLDRLLEEATTTGDYAPVYAALERCLPDARGGYSQGTLLMRGDCTLELARWAIARGTDVNAGDSRGCTPLHESASSRYRHALTPAQLIELGADPHRPTKNGRTPLHSAADGKNLDAVRLLLEHGADVHARNREGRTPLEYALARVQNIDLCDMQPVAAALLEAGAEVSDAAQTSVRAAAETFEFHRAGYAPDSVEQTAAACRALCTLFGVEPPAQRLVHDGVSPIVVPAGTVGEQHQQLWNLLVPSHGACGTVQGEVLRISGRIADEWFRNGGTNWDRDYVAMARAFCDHVSSRTPLPPEALAACQNVVRGLSSHPDSSERLMQWAVEWVQLNPEPIRLDPPPYSR